MNKNKHHTTLELIVAATTMHAWFMKLALGTKSAGSKLATFGKHSHLITPPCNNMRTDIIAGDKNGEMVKPGDRVIYNGKVEVIKELFEENDEVKIGLEAWFISYWVQEDEIELVVSK